MAQKGKTPAERLSEVRDRIAELEEERDALKDHPVSRDEALARFEEWLEARQGEFDRDVNVAGLLKNKANLSLSVVRFGNGERDVVPALAKIMPDALRATVTDKLDAALADREPMSTEERDKRAAELDQKLLEANREEERIIQEMHRAGTPVARRADASPAAVLGLDAPPAPPEPEAQERPAPWRYRDAQGREVIHHRLPGDVGAPHRPTRAQAGDSAGTDGFDRAVAKTKAKARDRSPDQ